MSIRNFLDKDGLLYVWSKVKNLVATKVDKVEGKGLSTNDYTSAEKAKLEGIATGANKTIVTNNLTSASTTDALSAAMGKELKTQIDAINTNMEDLGAGDMLKSVYDADGNGKVDNADNADKLGGIAASLYAQTSAIPTKVSQLTNDSGYLVEHQDISGKVDKVDGKGLSTNDLTDALKANYDAAYTHSQVTHAPSNAQANVIESVKVNGTAQTVVGKAVDITVPTKVSELDNDEGYLTEHQDISGKADKATTLAGYGITNAYTKEEVNLAIQASEYDDSALTARVAANEDAIGVLNGTGAGSVTKTVDDAINAFAANVSNDGTVNTYKELIDYAATHGAEFTELVGEVDVNTKAIATLNGDATTAGSVAKTATDVLTENMVAITNAEIDTICA